MDRTTAARSQNGLHEELRNAERDRKIAVLEEQIRFLREDAATRRSEIYQFKLVVVTAVLGAAIQIFMGAL